MNAQTRITDDITALVVYRLCIDDDAIAHHAASGIVQLPSTDQSQSPSRFDAARLVIDAAGVHIQGLL